MKICHYKRPTSLGVVSRLGIFFNQTTIIDVNFVMEAYFETFHFRNAKEKANHYFPSSLSQFLSLSLAPIDELKQVMQNYVTLSKRGILKTKSQAELAFDLKDNKKIKLGCPLDKIHSYRDFYTHEKHVKKGFEKRNEPIPQAWYEMPVYYKGSTTGFIGDDDFIVWPSYSKKLDYELELGLIIGKDGKDIKAKDAFKHIFGYTILNDISARDIQKKEMSVRLGPSKGKDFCSVLGPVIVTADEFDYKEPNLLMRAFINDQEWSKGHSGEAQFSWAQMIEFASQEEWLVAGDLLGSGTVGTGCGLELDRWIQPGDKIELEVESIGRLKNIVGTPNHE